MLATKNPRFPTDLSFGPRAAFDLVFLTTGTGDGCAESDPFFASADLVLEAIGGSADLAFLATDAGDGCAELGLFFASAALVLEATGDRLVFQSDFQPYKLKQNISVYN